MGAISCIASIACAHLNVTRIAVHNQAKIQVVVIRSIDNNTAAQIAAFVLVLLIVHIA